MRGPTHVRRPAPPCYHDAARIDVIVTGAGGTALRPGSGRRHKKDASGNRRRLLRSVERNQSPPARFLPVDLKMSFTLATA